MEMRDHGDAKRMAETNVKKVSGQTGHILGKGQVYGGRPVKQECGYESERNCEDAGHASHIPSAFCGIGVADVGAKDPEVEMVLERRVYKDPAHLLNTGPRRRQRDDEQYARFR